MAAGKKKKKNAITLLLMAAALVLLLVVYVAVTKSQERKAEEEAKKAAEDTSIALLSIDTSEIAAVAVASDQYDYALNLTENGWELAGDAEFPLDTTKTDSIAELLSAFSATRLVLEGVTDLSEYGLSEPAVKVTISMEDGTEREIWIGDQSVVDGGFYTCLDGSGDVYLVEEENRETFYLTESDLLLLDTIPTFSSSYVTGLKIVSDTFANLTVTDVPEEEFDLTARSVYTSSLYGVYDEPVHVDSTSFVEVMENYTSVALRNLVSYKEAALDEYGLKEPKTALTIWYEDSTTSEPGDFTLYVGAQDAAGENYYVRLEGSNQVFSLDKETVETMLTPDTFYIISKYTQMVNITIVGEMDITYGDTERIFELTHETETSEDGVATTTDFFTVDGKELTTEEESDAFRDIYQVLIGIKLTGELGEGDEMGQTSILSITFKDEAFEEMRTVCYKPLANDDTRCAIEVDGTAIFTAERTAIEEVIRQLTEYQP